MLAQPSRLDAEWPWFKTAFNYAHRELKDGMSSTRFLLWIGSLSVLVAIAAANPAGSGVIHIDHDKVSAVFAKGGTLVATNNFKVMALRRDRPGEVEVHDRDTDIVYVLDGSATFVTGGVTTEAKTIGPGETRGKEIKGGEEQRLEKGDVMIVPNGVPHWFKDVSAPFQYYVVKVSK